MLTRFLEHELLFLLLLPPSHLLPSTLLNFVHSSAPGKHDSILYTTVYFTLQPHCTALYKTVLHISCTSHTTVPCSAKFKSQPSVLKYKEYKMLRLSRVDVWTHTGEKIGVEQEWCINGCRRQQVARKKLPRAWTAPKFSLLATFHRLPPPYTHPVSDKMLLLLFFQNVQLCLATSLLHHKICFLIRPKR